MGTHHSSPVTTLQSPGGRGITESQRLKRETLSSVLGAAGAHVGSQNGSCPHDV